MNEWSVLDNSVSCQLWPSFLLRLGRSSWNERLAGTLRKVLEADITVSLGNIPSTFDRQNLVVFETIPPGAAQNIRILV